jgi:hypothetical protein
MERELWELLLHLLTRLCNRWPRGRFGDEEVLAVYLWAVVHDRPVSWACDRGHWPSDLIRYPLPSQPTMSRRLRTASVEQLMNSLEDQLLAISAVKYLWVRVIDAKALPVGGPSKDPDAQWGRGACAVQHGYKFHAVWGFGPLPIAWALAPLNVSEQRLAKELIRDLPGQGYLLGDSQFDSNALYDIAAEAGYQLVAARQRPGTRLGHRSHSPHRLRSIELLQRPFGKGLYKVRVRIEHCFAQLTTFVGGLGPLPFWVRRFSRVRLWVQAKLLINAIRILNQTNPQCLTAVE